MATSAMDTEKWETGIDATVTDITEVKAFVDWRLSTYKENGWKGFDLWESFVDDFESFTKDILNNLGKDRLKKIRDYLRENGVYVRKEARKSIADGLLGTIHEPTPSKWPTNETTDPTDDPTDDSTPALPLLPTAPVQAIQPSNTLSTPAPSAQSPSAEAPPAQAPSAQAPLASPLPPIAELPLPTNATAASNDLPPIAELPLPTNVTAVSNDLPPTAEPPLPTNVTAVSNDLPPTAEPPLPMNITATSTNTIAPLTSAPNTRLTEAKATTYGRDLATLAKMYTEESKYNGEDDNLDCKLTIFNDLYDRAKIPQAAKIKGLPTVLRSITLNFYYRSKATYITFDGIG